MNDLYEKILEGRRAEDRLGDGMMERGLEDWSSLGFDDYDDSIEVYGIPPEHPMPAEVAEYLLSECGFAKVYANQKDGWEVHFHKGATSGWRRRWVKDNESVHNRVIAGTPDYGYWEVSEFPSGWPTKWLESGYVKVVGSA